MMASAAAPDRGAVGRRQTVPWRGRRRRLWFGLLTILGLAERGYFIPRLQIGRNLTESLQFGAYRNVFEAKVYDGERLGLGADRVDVVFELRGSRRKR